MQEKIKFLKLTILWTISAPSSPYINNSIAYCSMLNYAHLLMSLCNPCFFEFLLPLSMYFSHSLTLNCHSIFFSSQLCLLFFSSIPRSTSHFSLSNTHKKAKWDTWTWKKAAFTSALFTYSSTGSLVFPIFCVYTVQ